MSLGILLGTLVVDCIVQVGKDHKEIYNGSKSKISNKIKDFLVSDWFLEYDNKLKEYVLFVQVY